MSRKGSRERHSVSFFSPRLTMSGSRFMRSVAFCYSRKRRAVAGHPHSRLNELMVYGLQPDTKGQVFVSAMLFAVSIDSWFGGIGFADNKE